jgi:hypothetical protein
VLQAADKRDKFEFIDIMNDDFIRERICVSTAEWEPERLPEFTDAARAGTEEYVSRHKCGLLLASVARVRRRVRTGSGRRGWSRSRGLLQDLPQGQGMWRWLHLA